MKREVGLLLCTVSVLGLLSWGLVSGGPDTRRPRPGRKQLDLPVLPPEDPVVSLGAGAPQRDPFREPRETEPLPPLELPLPPLPPLASLLPPPEPDSGPAWWSQHLLLHPTPPPGDLDELIEVPDSPDSSPVSDSSPAATSADTALGQDEEGYSLLYDRVQRNALTVLWGRILDEDRFDKIPGQDTIHFQEIDPRTGKERFGVQTLAPGDYESFRFARTLANQIERKVRDIGHSAGNLPERLRLITWLLAQAQKEPAALAHAEDLAREGVRLAPDDMKSWLALGDVFETAFRFDEALALFARMAGIRSPGSAPDLGVDLADGRFARRAAPRVRIGQILERFGLDREAEAQYRGAVALHDPEPSAQRALGSLLARSGRAEEAVDLLQRSLDLYPSRSSPEAQAHGVALGRALLRAGRFEEAAAAFAEVLRAAPAGGSPGERDARCGAVSAAYLSGDFARAFELADAGVQALGPGPRLLYQRGIAAAASGQPAAEAMRDLREAARAAPLDAAPAWAAQAFWLGVLGKDEEAGQALATALDLAPHLPFGLALRARRARADLDLEAARTDLRALIARAPRCAAALGELGWLLHDEGRTALAEVALRRASQEAPEWSGIALRRAFNLLESGDSEGARGILLGIGEAGHAVVRNGLAWADYLEGDLSGAVGEFAALQNELRATPDDPQAVYARTWQQRITEHAKLVRWTDGFDGKLPRPQWDVRSNARLGVEPRVLDGRLWIRGRHDGAGRTRVMRRIRALDFRSFAADLTVGADHQGTAGLSISLENRRSTSWSFRIVRDQDGQVDWEQQRGSREPEYGRLPLRIPPDRPVRISFALDRERTPPILTVRVADTVAWEGPVSVLRTPSGDLYESLFVQTLNALEVDVALDNVEMVFAQP